MKTMKKIAAALVIAGFSAAASAAGGTGTVTSISITGGDFSMGAPGVGACGSGGPFGSFQCITGGATINTIDNLFEGPTLTNLVFFSQPVNTFTALTAAGAANSLSGNPIQGTATASQITLDLGSWYVNWSGSNFLQAPVGSTVVGSYDSGTGAFNLSWSSLITTQPFPGQTGYWNVSGIATAAPVPEASTYAMMLAGLGLVGTMVGRRRKSMAV